MPKRLSFQLYSARNFPLKKTLALLAKAGYRDVEGYGDIYGDAPAVRRLLDRHGLAMPTGHFGLDMLQGDPARVIEIAVTLGIRQIYAPWLAPEDRPRTATGYRKLGRRLASIEKWVRAEGMGFGWHNHDFEFVKLPSGETPIDVLFEAAPTLDWEIDVAWVKRAGANPVAWIKRHAGRITAVHVKDIARKGEGANEDGWADVGEGTVNWPACLAALAGSRAMHFILEHDNPADVARFATRSFDYISQI